MAHISTFKQMFKGITLEVDDLYLLEAFQLRYFPGWVPERELAAVLWAYPAIENFMIKKQPAMASFIQHVKADFGPAKDQDELVACSDKLVWTIADLLVYNKCPEAYDSQEFHKWDFKEVTSITSLQHKTVIDGGAGTGRVTFAAAQIARHVFAVEPVTRLRQFIRDMRSILGANNVFVMDGFLHDMPFPNQFADVIITSHALGWSLEAELTEMERVIKTGGFIIHCPGTAEGVEEEIHARLISPDWKYRYARYQEPDGWKRKYWKQLGASQPA